MHTYKIATIAFLMGLGIGIKNSKENAHLKLALHQRSLASTAKKFRLIQARELLGGKYNKSVVRGGEMVDDLRTFIFDQVSESVESEQAASSITHAIATESVKRGFDPIFLLSVINNESRFNIFARGRHGEIGLMQIKPTTAAWIARKYKIHWTGGHNLVNPAMNIKIGAAYLDYLRGKFRNRGHHYLAAYNMGTFKLRQALKSEHPPKEYSRKVMDFYVNYYKELCKTTIVAQL